MPGRGWAKGFKDETNTNPEQKRKRGPSVLSLVVEEMPAKATKVSKGKDKHKASSKVNESDKKLNITKSPKGDKRKFTVQSLDEADRQRVNEDITNDSDGEGFD